MDADRPGYDYLLVVGPGRSGSTFLYELLNRHAAFAAPDAKEGRYYRSPRRLGQALRRARRTRPSTVLLDVANLAYRDRALAPGVKALKGRGYALLLVVLLREHRARAVSMMKYRRSRGEWSALLGARLLERVVVRDSLSVEDLARIFATGVDVLVVDFPTLVGDTARFLEVLAGLCGVAAFEDPRDRPVNESVRARSMALSAAAKLAAVALRAAGCLRLLQRLKDSPRVQRVFFRPGAVTTDPVRLSARAERRLLARYAACRRVIDAAGERLDEGIWLTRAAPGPPGPRPR